MSLGREKTLKGQDTNLLLFFRGTENIFRDCYKCLFAFMANKVQLIFSDYVLEVKGA
jgi:hypothetical protein